MSARPRPDAWRAMKKKTKAPGKVMKVPTARERAGTANSVYIERISSRKARFCTGSAQALYSDNFSVNFPIISKVEAAASAENGATFLGSMVAGTGGSQEV